MALDDDEFDRPQKEIKQYVEMNALSSGTNGKSSSSYRIAFCVQHATYN